LESRDVIGHVTIRLAVGDFLWVVHCDHASILHRYGDMKSQTLDGRTDVQVCARMDAQVILYTVQCYAGKWQHPTVNFSDPRRYCYAKHRQKWGGVMTENSWTLCSLT